MMKVFENAKFGDKFLTRYNRMALFIRFVNNSEWKMAHLYVKDWGMVSVNVENGRTFNGIRKFDIVKKEERQ